MTSQPKNMHCCQNVVKNKVNI